MESESVTVSLSQLDHIRSTASFPQHQIDCICLTTPARPYQLECIRSTASLRSRQVDSISVPKSARPYHLYHIRSTASVRLQFDCISSIVSARPFQLDHIKSTASVRLCQGDNISLTALARPYHDHLVHFISTASARLRVDCFSAIASARPSQLDRTKLTAPVRLRQGDSISLTASARPNHLDHIRWTRKT